MLRTQYSRIHRNGNVLCASNSDKGSQSVPCSSLGYPRGSLYFDSGRVCERSSFDQQMYPTLEIPAYYSVPPLGYTRYPGQTFPHYSVTEVPSDATQYDLPVWQHFDNPTTYRGAVYNIPAAGQPPTPPTTPEEANHTEFNHYSCRWQGGTRCSGAAPGKNREMSEHLRVHHQFIGHERDTVQCQWEGCGQTMQRMNVARHIVSRHLLAAACCRFCRKRFCRPDVVSRHEKTCNALLSAESNSAESNLAARI